MIRHHKSAATYLDISLISPEQTYQVNGGWPAYVYTDGSDPDAPSAILRREDDSPALRLYSRPIADSPNRFAIEFADQFNEYQQDSLELVDAEDIARTGQEITGRLVADRAVRVRVTLDDGERPRTLARWEELASEHELLVLGLAPDTTYAIRAEVEDADGLVRVSEPWTWRSPPLPEGFPPLHVTVSRPRLMEPGVTLIPANRWPGRGDLDREFGARGAAE